MSVWSSALKLGLGVRRVPMMLQADAAEAGLVCLAMVASYHGLDTDMATLRERYPVSPKGTTMMDLARIASQVQLNARTFPAEVAHLRRLQLPCVLQWDLNRFVVLTEVYGSGPLGVTTVVINDPGRGVRHLTIHQLVKHFAGMVLELVPSADFRPRVDRLSVPWHRLLGGVAGLRRSLLQILALTLAFEFFVLLLPIFLQWTVDGVLVSGDRELLVALGLGMGLLVLFQVATGTVRSWAILHLSTLLKLQCVENVFAHLLRLPVSWFERRHAGEVSSRFDAIQRAQQIMTTGFVEAVLDGSLAILALVMMWVYSGTLMAIALGCVVAYGLLRWALFRPMHDAAAEAVVHDAKRASHFLESLRGVQSIKLSNRQESRHADFMVLVADAMNANVAMRKLDLMFGVLRQLVFGLERVAVVWIGALLVTDRHLSVGMLFAFLAYQEQFTARFSALIDKVVRLRLLRLQGDRLADIVVSPAETQLLVSPRRQDLSARLELRGVGFRYSDSEPAVIRGLNLVIEAGESVAIAGPSGCGKTTLLKLMVGIREPQLGEVRVGGLPLAQLGLSAWRDMVGTVLQDDQLFAGSIIDNISFFEAQPEFAWAEECAKVAAIHDEVEQMPMAYHTLIGDMGAGVSAGQKQRLLLARALYKRPKILFLDEATSALDVALERRVNQALRKLNVTRVIVAHRPETISSAQRVIVLQGGRIAQDLRTVPTGSHASV